jgi:NADPH-dependent glutamate synthase beta subunit-like oxidoreductase
MDAARCALRLGAGVSIVYRRTERELPARIEEVEHAKEEGIHFFLLTSPVRINDGEKGWVNSITCEKMVGVYAGGDAVTGAATVILAMGAGKKSAEAIDRYLCGNE